MIIGISGGTGAGKTTLVNYVEEILVKDETLILSQDRYYKHLPSSETNATRLLFHVNIGWQF